VDICPGHAISGINWQAGIPRESLYDAYACRETAREFERVRKVVHDNICGMCIVTCPWTKKYLEKAG
jgi:epoxyqueuosine reductase